MRPRFDCDDWASNRICPERPPVPSILTAFGPPSSSGQATPLDVHDVDERALDAVVLRGRTLARLVSDDIGVDRADAEASLQRLVAAGDVVMDGTRFAPSERVITARLSVLLDRAGVDPARLRLAWSFEWLAASNPDRPDLFDVTIRRKGQGRENRFVVLRDGVQDQAFDHVTGEPFPLTYQGFESAVAAVFVGPFGVVP